MFSSPFQQQLALCWPPLLFAFIAVSSITAEGTEYSRIPLIYLTNSHTSSSAHKNLPLSQLLRQNKSENPVEMASTTQFASYL